MKTNILLILVALFVATLKSVADTKTLYPSQDAVVGTNYNTKTFGNDEFIGLGGWGDMYISLLQFDLSTVRGTVTSAELTLTPDSRTQNVIDHNATTGGIVRANYFSWRENGTWIDDIGYYSDLDELFSRPTRMSAIRIDVTDFVTAWVKGDIPNYGFILEPRSTNNNWTYFRSREYGGSTRPKLVVNFTPPPTQSSSTLSLKLPLPGGKKWKVSTQAGGLSYDNTIDSYHRGRGFYSIDFDDVYKIGSGTPSYSDPDKYDVPVMAAAGGIIVTCQYGSDTGNYIKIDHDGDGNLNTGYQTMYMHMKDTREGNYTQSPFLAVGARINVGQVLGFIGDTGDSKGSHLHFQVLYRNTGSSQSTTGTSTELNNVKLEGQSITSFRVNQYYLSTSRNVDIIRR